MAERYIAWCPLPGFSSGYWAVQLEPSSALYRSLHYSILFRAVMRLPLVLMCASELSKTVSFSVCYKRDTVGEFQFNLNSILRFVIWLYVAQRNFSTEKCRITVNSFNSDICNLTSLKFNIKKTHCICHADRLVGKCFQACVISMESCPVRSLFFFSGQRNWMHDTIGSTIWEGREQCTWKSGFFSPRTFHYGICRNGTKLNAAKVGTDEIGYGKMHFRQPLCRYLQSPLSACGISLA